ncbi:MAG: hypothetical protein IPK67_02480 [Planctomycetes bacterium]|nr:hypothetical protein [Planctomycetota bacterium]
MSAGRGAAGAPADAPGVGVLLPPVEGGGVGAPPPPCEGGVLGGGGPYWASAGAAVTSVKVAAAIQLFFMGFISHFRRRTD